MNTFKELHSTNFANVINDAVEGLYPKCSKKVLTVHINMSASYFDKRYFKEFLLFFYRPSTYTFVGLLESDILFNMNSGAKTELEFLSYHDSCWRSSGAETVINRYAAEMDKFFGEDFEGEIDIYNSIGMLGFSLIDGTVVQDKTERTAYYVAP
jgi:hypothetical protein